MNKITLSTPLGQMILIAHAGNLIYCNWDEKDCLKKLQRIERLCSLSPHNGGDNCLLEITATQLMEYFQGSRRKFDLPVSLLGSGFSKRVWEHLAEISFGEVVTYGKLAEICGGKEKARAAAKACGANPLAIIVPCHRVIGAGGASGGYTGGVEKKRWLLMHEQRIRRHSETHLN